MTRAADKVSIEFTLKRGPVSSEVERKRKAMHVPSNEIHSRSSPLYTSNVPSSFWGKRFALTLRRGTATRPTVTGRVAMGLHNSPAPRALGKPRRAPSCIATAPPARIGVHASADDAGDMTAPTILAPALGGVRGQPGFPTHTNSSPVE